MTADLTADSELAPAPVMAVKGRAAPMAGAGSLTADLIQRRKTAKVPGVDLPLVGFERPAPPMQPAASVAPLPEVVAVPREQPAPAPKRRATDLVAPAVTARADELPSSARALRRDLTAQRRSGGMLQSSALFVLVFVVTFAVMIWALM